MARKPAKILFGKQAISIRIDAAILAFFRKKGRGWQSLVNQILRDFMEKDK
jgi:uncharacterized protein (DUF4415 family)